MNVGEVCGVWKAAFGVMLLSLCFQSSQAQDTLSDDAAFKVASVQYHIEGNRSIDQLLAKMERCVKQGVDDEADCVVFPELITFDTWRVHEVESHATPTPEEIAETRRIAEQVTPDYLKRTAELAIKYDVDILAGTTARFQDNAIFNTAFLFFRDGTHVSQDKLYPTQWERMVGIESGKELRTFDARWGKSVILTCYDIEFPDVSALLVSEQPETIFVPSMTESTSGLQRVRWCSQARAVEHHAFVVVSGTVGKPSASWEHFGQAAVIAPRDKFFEGEPNVGPLNEPFVLSVRLNMQRLRESRGESVFIPSLDMMKRLPVDAVQVTPTVEHRAGQRG